MFYGLFADKPRAKRGIEKIKFIRRKYTLLLIPADCYKAKNCFFLPNVPLMTYKYIVYNSIEQDASRYC